VVIPSGYLVETARRQTICLSDLERGDGEKHVGGLRDVGGVHVVVVRRAGVVVLLEVQ